MQRYLDRDLGETEYRRMLQHLQQCPDCTELFERLVNLSHELENLPKVTPPFSLVDAIMPKLERLEAMGSSPEAIPFEQTEAVDTAAAETAPDTAAKRKGSGGWRKNVREWISFPVFGGVVAAGLVAGFFLYGQQSQSDSDAGKLLLSLPGAAKKSESVADSKTSAPASKNVGSNQQPAAAGSMPDVKSNAAAGGAESSSAGANSTAPVTDPNAAAKSEAPGASPDANVQKDQAAAPPAPAPAPDRQRAVEPGGAAQQQAAPTPAPTPVPGAADAQARPAGPPAPAESAPQPPGGSANEPLSTFAAPAPQAAQPQANSTAPAAGTGDQAKNDQPPAESNGPNPAEKRVQGEYGTRSMGITAMPAPPPAPVTELSTADGVYKAVIRDEKVTVLDKEGKTVYASKYDWKDGNFRIELVEWSSDYKLTYKVKASDQVRTFVIAIKDKTETESKP